MLILTESYRQKIKSIFVHRSRYDSHPNRFWNNFLIWTVSKYELFHLLDWSENEIYNYKVQNYNGCTLCLQLSWTCDHVKRRRRWTFVRIGPRQGRLVWRPAFCSRHWTVLKRIRGAWNLGVSLEVLTAVKSLFERCRRSWFLFQWRISYVTISMDVTFSDDAKWNTH